MKDNRIFYINRIDVILGGWRNSFVHLHICSKLRCHTAYLSKMWPSQPIERLAIMPISIACLKTPPIKYIYMLLLRFKVLTQKLKLSLSNHKSGKVMDRINNDQETILSNMERKRSWGRGVGLRDIGPGEVTKGQYAGIVYLSVEILIHKKERKTTFPL